MYETFKFTFGRLNFKRMSYTFLFEAPNLGDNNSVNLINFIRMLQQTDFFCFCFIASLEALVSFLMGNGVSLALV